MSEVETRLTFLNSEALLSAIVDSSDDAIVSKNLDGIVTSWNKGAEMLFGYTAAEMIGQPILKIIPAERTLEEPAILERLRRGEKVDHFETQRVRKDGALVEVSLTISPVRDSNGRIVGASKIARNIGAQKGAARALAEASLESTRQSRMKDEFLATLSHELRTPLQSILGWVQLLRANDYKDTELKEGLDIIDRNAQAQQRIIEDLLDMNRILSGKVRLDVQVVNLGMVIEAAMASIRPAADAKGVRMHSILDSISKPVSGDPQRLQQIFWNLLSNAVKFTPKNGRVEVVLQSVNSHLEVSVSDTGVGIEADFLPFVFDRFRQADASFTRSHGGLGLGLAIVKHLVELHGGTVRAKSAGANRGATFEVNLPLAVLNASRDESKRHVALEPENEADLPDLHEVKVVLVDDDVDSRMLVAKALASVGASVRAAGSAQEALMFLADHVPSILISDIGMPGESGYDLIRKVRSLPPERGGKVPAVALTAYTRVEDKVRALRSGFHTLIAKPADISEVIATVKALATRD